MSDNKKLEIIDLFKAHKISVREFQITIKDLYIDNSKDFIIKKFLTDNFEIGNNHDSVKLRYIKKLLKEKNDIEIKDQQLLIDIIQKVFEKSEFKKHSTINNVSTRNFFILLKIKS